MYSASRSDIDRARGLRSTTTDAEEHLWMRLRGDQLAGHRFRRQVPIGPFVVDFACRKARLAIEVDGSQHIAASLEDDRRSAWLASRGYRVLRFWNNQVLEETDGVLESIRVALGAGEGKRGEGNGAGLAAEIGLLDVRVSAQRGAGSA